MTDIETKAKILATAEEMFMRHGYSRVTMEEIASTLGMSKKTLYKFFSNKKEVLRELVSVRQSETMDHIERIWMSEELDFVGKFRSTLDYVGERSSKFSRLRDIRQRKKFRIACIGLPLKRTATGGRKNDRR